MNEFAADAEKQVVSQLIKFGLDRATNFLSKSNTALKTTEQRIHFAIESHTREVASWSSEISFKDLQRPKATSEVFVPLDIYLLPRRNRFSVDEASLSAPLEELLSRSIGHVIILGQPGAGKTTSIKHMCQEMLTGSRFSETQSFPILIRLRDLNKAKLAQNAEESDLLVEKLQEVLDISIAFSESSDLSEGLVARRAIRERAVIEVLESLHPLVLLDGLDEVAHKRKRDALVDELRRLAPKIEKARFILTSRTGEFNYHIDRVTTYEIAPLSQGQIQTFAKYWLGDEQGGIFLGQIRSSPFADTAIKPLTLAHLCAIYERVQKIPDKPKSVYRKIVKLLLEEWDQQRSVKRDSAYAGFDVDRKEEFLADMAHCLTSSQKSSTFSRPDLLECFSHIRENYDLPESEAQDVVNEIETHTGLFLQSGNELFEFSHKSLQEYLTAVFIGGLPAIPANMVELQLMPNELAITIALSSRPAEYFTRLIMDHFRSYKLSFSFIRTFISRLLIERPDFEKNVEVGTALLVLYSQYLQAFISEALQLQLFIEDQLEDEFEELGELIRSRIRLQEVLKAYDAYSHAHSLNGEQIWRLQRKKHARGSFALFARSNVLPKTLYIRNSLLSPAGIAVEALAPPTPDAGTKQKSRPSE